MAKDKDKEPDVQPQSPERREIRRAEGDLGEPDAPASSRDLLKVDKQELAREAAKFMKKLRLPVRVAEEFQRLKNYMLVRTETEGSQALAVTAARFKEGVSFVSLNLGISLARGFEHSVLLVDANFRQPQLHKTFRSQNPTGLTDIVVARVEAYRAIRPTYMPNLAFLPCGTERVDPGQLFRSERFGRLLAELKRRFDYVIFDTAPAGEFADVLVLAPRVDSVILVVRAHRTKHHVVNYVREEIEKNGGKIAGVVLNRRRFWIPEFIYRRI